MYDFQLTVTAEWLAFEKNLSVENFDKIAVHSAKVASECGFAGVELPLPHAACLFDDLPPNYWRDLAGRLNDLGAPVKSIHGPNFPPLSCDIDKAYTQMATQWKIACEMDVDAFVVHPTSHSHPHVVQAAKDLLERDVALCKRLLDIGFGRAKLAVENLPTYGLAHLHRLLDQIEDNRLGICFDTGHWNVRPEHNIPDVIRSFGDRIQHLHLSDNPGWCDAHLPPGEGNFHWQEFVGSLPKQWLERPMLIELSVPLRVSSEDSADQTVDVWKQAYQKAMATLNDALTKANRQSPERIPM